MFMRLPENVFHRLSLPFVLEKDNIFPDLILKYIIFSLTLNIMNRPVQPFVQLFVQLFVRPFVRPFVNQINILKPLHNRLWENIIKPTFH